MRPLLYVLFELPLVPLQTAGTVVAATRSLLSQRQGISATASKVVQIRLVLHTSGMRPDPATEQLCRHLPMFGPFATWAMGTVGWPMRWSGFAPANLRYPVARPTSFSQWMPHRTGFFDRTIAEAIADAGIEQFVILGAGWDARAWGMLADAGVRVFEVDAPATQAAKRRAVEAAGLSTEHVSFVATDFLEKSWLEALRETDFDPTRTTYLLWEGVTPYLDMDAVSATLRDVSTLPPGSRIAFDYLSRELLRAEAPFERLGKMIARSMGIFANERFTWGIPTRPPFREHLIHLLESRGLQLAEVEPMGDPEHPVGGLALAIVPGE